MLVVDASVLVSALVDSGDEGSWAEARLETDWLAAPHLVYAEATNILRRLESSGLITAAVAGAARDDLLRLPLELFPFEPFADRVWQLRANVTSYDAWYVAIAEALEVPLATLDRRLATAPGPGCAFATPG